MTLQLVDRSTRHPRGIIEDILVKVDRFIFPINFVLLDVDEDAETPLNLGRSFITICRALIDVRDCRMVFRVGDEEVVFRLLEAVKHSLEFVDSFYCIDATDLCVDDFL